MMANYLDANPEERRMVEHHRSHDQGMVPVAADGALACLVNARRIEGYGLSSPLPVADYVVGMELLGNRFSIFHDDRGRQHVGVMFLSEPRPSSWAKHERAIEAAFAGHARRVDELTEFLLARDGEAL